MNRQDPPKNANGLKHGMCISYYKNGNVLYKGFYNNGKEHGIWKFYSENGKLHASNKWHNGVQIGGTSYYE